MIRDRIRAFVGLFFVAGFGAVLFLAGCVGGAQRTGIDLTQDVGAGLARNISASEVEQIKSLCVQAAPGLLAATAPTAPVTVRDVAVYPKAFCEQYLSGKQYVDPTQQSITWLDRVLNMTAVAARVAGYVVPVVLSLL